jgi:hypothetical protein
VAVLESGVEWSGVERGGGGGCRWKCGIGRLGREEKRVEAAIQRLYT